MIPVYFGVLRYSYQALWACLRATTAPSLLPPDRKFMIILLNAVLRTLAMTILVAMAGHAVGQQTFPVKPIRIVIPFPPGGANTTVARLLGQKMTENWGPQVIVDNRPGGNSIIGTEYVAKSAPDGYTLTLISSAHVINSVLLPNLPYGIAVSSNTRVSALPHLPPIAETGLPGYEVKSWQGILAPASTPKEIIARLSSEIARILALADIREKMVSSGLEPYILSPDAFAALLKTETVKFAKVIQAANIRLEE